MSTILLKGGNVLIHDPQDHVTWIESDVLIEGRYIRKIGKDINPPAGTTLIDCCNKIVSPGFVDTHRHVWQSQMKGRHPDGLLLDYMVNDFAQGGKFTTEDVFWGELAGCMEGIDNGTTTIVDSSHIQYSPDHGIANATLYDGKFDILIGRNALRATICSGIRSLFGYCPTPRITSWSPIDINQDMLEDWVIETLVELAGSSPHADGRVEVALNFESWFLPKNVVLDLFEKAKNAGIRYFLAHYVNNAILNPYFAAGSSVPVIVDSYGLLNNSFLLIHATNPTVEDIEVMRRTKSPISVCPTTEYQMAQGEAICFNDDIGLQQQCSLGIDCHTNNSAYIPAEMRLALAYTRGHYNQKFINQGKQPKKINHTIEEAFNLGTIQGARAVKMGDKIGSIAEGKFADIVIYNTTSPAMLCAAQHNPLAAVVIHSSPGDIDTVVVDGILRKYAGKLQPIELDHRSQTIAGTSKTKLTWDEVAEAVLMSQTRIYKKIEIPDLDTAKEQLAAKLGVNHDNLVSSL